MINIRLLVFTCLLCLTQSAILGQNLKGEILNNKSEIMPFVKVKDTVYQTYTLSDQYGRFSIPIQDSSVLVFSYMGYKPKYLTIDNSELFYDGITIEMENYIKLLSRVDVTAKRVKKVVDQYSVNVLDYIPYTDFSLVIKSYKNEKYLSIEGYDTTYYQFNISETKAKRLVEDCYGNIHILSKDSAYQIWLDTSMHYISTVSLSDFNEFIKPCIADFGDRTVFYNYSNHNKLYTLTSIGKTTKEKNHFYHARDKIAEKVAAINYNEIIAYYYKVTPLHNNIIELGLWNGDLLLLADNGHLVNMIIWYTKVRGREIKVKSFQAKKVLVTFDYLNDSIVVFNIDGDELSRSYFEGDDKSNGIILPDLSTGMFYRLSEKNGTYSLFEIDISTGHQKSVLTLKEERFPQDLKVHNDWLYFRAMDRNMYRLFKVRIPNHGC